MSLTDNLIIRPYQQEMLDKFRDKQHVLCADDMGLGKTVQALALDDIRRQQGSGPTLVVCPLSGVVDNWVEHITEYTDLRVRRVDPKNRKSLFKEDADIYIIHWDGLRLEWEAISKAYWLHVIADEVHRAKNRKTKQSKALKKLKPEFKTGLTGTPIDNHPAEIWSILNWLYPQEPYFRSYWRFYNNFVEDLPIYDPNADRTYRKIVGTKNEAEFHKLIASFFIRRKKDDVLTDLPDKQYVRRTVQLSPQERKTYDQMRKEMVAWIGENEDQPIMAPAVVAKMVRLQQCTLGTISFDGDDVVIDEPSTKINELINIISDMDEDRQFVVFSKSKQAIMLASDKLDKENVDHTLITGDTPQENRDGIISNFRAGKTRAFLATIRSGGTGINLQNADVAIFLDREWSPGENRQAEDRLHRSGQKNAVTIIDITADNTIDMGKDQALEQKWGWIKNMIGD